MVNQDVFLKLRPRVRMFQAFQGVSRLELVPSPGSPKSIKPLRLEKMEYVSKIWGGRSYEEPFGEGFRPGW